MQPDKSRCSGQDSELGCVAVGEAKKSFWFYVYTRMETDEDGWSFVKKQTDTNAFLSTLSAKINKITYEVKRILAHTLVQIVP